MDASENSHSGNFNFEMNRWYKIRVRATPSNIEAWLDEKKIVIETLTAFRRAGADLIITYHAKEAARLLAKP